MKLFIIAIMLGILLITGCSQQQSGTGTSIITNTPVSNQSSSANSQQSNVKEFKIIIQHTGYTPTLISVNRGDKVRILATTVPGQEYHKHGVTIDEYGVNIAVRTTDLNNSVKIEFIADKAGTFKIYCKTCNDNDGWKGATGTTHPDISATLEVK